jgi:hypothetical protein
VRMEALCGMGWSLTKRCVRLAGSYKHCLLPNLDPQVVGF